MYLIILFPCMWHGNILVLVLMFLSGFIHFLDDWRNNLRRTEEWRWYYVVVKSSKEHDEESLWSLLRAEMLNGAQYCMLFRYIVKGAAPSMLFQCYRLWQDWYMLTNLLGYLGGMLIDYKRTTGCTCAWYMNIMKTQQLAKRRFSNFHATSLKEIMRQWVPTSHLNSDK